MPSPLEPGPGAAQPKPMCEKLWTLPPARNFEGLCRQAHFVERIGDARGAVRGIASNVEIDELELRANQFFRSPKLLIDEIKCFALGREQKFACRNSTKRITNYQKVPLKIRIFVVIKYLSPTNITFQHLRDNR